MIFECFSDQDSHSGLQILVLPALLGALEVARTLGLQLAVFGCRKRHSREEFSRHLKHGGMFSGRPSRRTDGCSVIYDREPNCHVYREKCFYVFSSGGSEL